jgi:hypothetical protein
VCKDVFIASRLGLDYQVGRERVGDIGSVQHDQPVNRGYNDGSVRGRMSTPRCCTPCSRTYNSSKKTRKA